MRLMPHTFAIAATLLAGPAWSHGDAHASKDINAPR